MFKIGLAVILIAGILLSSRLKLFGIKNIDCKLNHYPCPMEMEPILLSFIGKNIFELDTASAGRQLTSFDPTLTEIKLNKELPDKLKIDLIRRLPIAMIKIVDDLNFDASLSAQPTQRSFYLDKTGFVYSPSTLVNQPLPEIWWPTATAINPGQSAGSAGLAQLVNTLNAYYVSFKSVARMTEGTYIIQTSLGPAAVVGNATDFSTAVASLQFILTNLKMGEKVPAKIDLRFDKPILTY